MVGVAAGFAFAPTVSRVPYKPSTIHTSVPSSSTRFSARPRPRPRFVVAARYSSTPRTTANAAASPAEAAFDIKLPRRSFLVQFTCNKCGERIKRLINRVAYERGTVFLQCAGCQVYHKFVDNLGLVVEYDLREENGADTNSKD